MMPVELSPALFKFLILIGLLVFHVRIFRFIMVAMLDRDPERYPPDKFKPIVRIRSAADPIYREYDRFLLCLFVFILLTALIL